MNDKNIKACTKNLIDLLDGNIIYNIPIYQRPYSWGENELIRLILDIFNAINQDEEDLFMGTIQFGKTVEENKIDVIDGQQRLTTFMLILNILKEKYGEIDSVREDRLNFLETQVNGKKQMEFLDDFYKSISRKNEFSKANNKYIENYKILKELIEEQLDKNVDSKKILETILEKIYFVVIETNTTLTKNLKIFNSINTTGMDLDGGDIFKIRMYDYLSINIKDPVKCFEKINIIYDLIDSNNTKEGIGGNGKTNINEILTMYQFILISKYKLSKELFTYGSDTFYDRLFDGILGVRKWDNFSQVYENSHIKVDINEIEKLVRLRIEADTIKLMESCELNFIYGSRYGRYWILPLIFKFKFGSQRLNEFTEALMKLIMVYSIRFLKGINQMKTFLNNVVMDMFHGKTVDEIIKKINQKKLIKENEIEINRILEGDIFYNARMKNIICYMSAMLDDDKTRPYNNIFSERYDIEHIQPQSFKNTKVSDVEKRQWEDQINTIGNLVILEYDINRSIQDSSFNEKKYSYNKSNVKSIEKISKENNWTILECIERKKKEVIKIREYLFN